MAHFVRSRITTKDKLTGIPTEIIHFISNSYIHFPLQISFAIEDVRNEFGKYESIEELSKNKSNLLEETLEIIELVERLKIENFLVEFLEDVGDHYPLSEFIQFVVANKKIVKESILSNVDEEGNLYCESLLGFDYQLEEAPFTSYESAKRKYFKLT
ncbi:hypothetical protein [Flavobacterium sp. 245]|uniref:hypothetical protein n=1 Tax=Flavobacterium sp. 245 TaxID=2512115 RepID=UPI00105B999F|nr:hypothetical protein [Flavobacterium sp. 245]TDO99267.1 hypothetical protein EV145_107175 [Flavobacterium sp. 245]